MCFVREYIGSFVREYIGRRNVATQLSFPFCVFREIEALIFRANVKRRAQYYAITFMIQIQLRQR